jgi:CheY-like chemotaxis protein
MSDEFQNISLRVPAKRFTGWDHFIDTVPEYSIGVEVIDDIPGHRGHFVHFDHHAGVVREAAMSAAMQAYIAVRQGRLMERWLKRRSPVPVYVWNADQDVCLTAFVLEYHHMLERAEGMPMLRWIVQYNNKIDVCGGLYPVNLDDLVENHFTWVFEPYREQRMRGKCVGDEALVKSTIRAVCDRLLALIEGRAGKSPITARPEILHESPYDFVIVDEKGDPNSRLVLAAQGHRNLISQITTRDDGRYTYSVIRGSPYDEDVFDVGKLIEAFQAAEDQPFARIWGGSNLAAGSDSVLGSSLHWTQLRDIAEPIVREASERAARGGTETARAASFKVRVLLVMRPEMRLLLRRTLESCGAEVWAAGSYGEAEEFFIAQQGFDAVFTSMDLPDGNYGRVLSLTSGPRTGDPIPVTVCLRKADGGWVDLLEHGAVRLLVEPFTPESIREALDGMLAVRVRPGA